MSTIGVTDTTEDPVELMLKKTGCISLHYKVQVIFLQFSRSVIDEP